MRKIIFLVLLALCVGCNRNGGIFNAKEKTFGNFGHEFTLRAEPMVFDSTVVATLGVHYIDGLLMFSHYAGAHFFSLYDLQTNKFIGSFLRRGRGPDEFTVLSYWDEYALQNQNRWLYMSDVNANKIIKFNLIDFIMTDDTHIEYLNQYETRHWKNYVINDSTFIAHMFAEENNGMRVFYRKYFSTSDDRQEIDFATVNNYAEFEKLGMSGYIRPDKKKIAMPMIFMNRVNIFDIDNPKRNITLTPKGAHNVSPSELAQQDPAQSVLFYHGIKTTQDHIFTLYYNQSLSEWQRQPKKLEMHVFDWDGEPLFKLNLDEYLAGFCVDPQGKTMYAFDYDENIYRYDLSRIMN